MSKQRAKAKPDDYAWHGVPQAGVGELKGNIFDAASRLDAEAFPRRVKASISFDVCSLLSVSMAEAIEPYTMSEEDRKEVFTLLECAAQQGFALALHRYEKHLRMVPELSKWHKNRDAAGARGRATQASTAASRAARAQSMLNSGMEVAAIADELRCSIPTVYRYLNNAAKPRKPRARSRKA